MIKKNKNKKKDLYFESIDHTQCHPLECYLHNAKLEGLTEITLVKADPDDGTPDFIWCTHYGDCVELSECKKSICDYYESTSGRGRCRNKGNLYLHGDEKTFKIEL